MLASLTSSLTSYVRDHGLYAVFVLMFVDAVLPAASELVMVVGGALAAGAFGATVTLFGAELSEGFSAYLAVSLAGTLGYLAGSLAGWAIGRVGGRPFIERHGRWLHIGPDRFARAERWFERYGSAFVFFGRLTPLVRSFVSIPAGVLEFPLGRYTILTAAASLVWCVAFGVAGYTLGTHWDGLHHAFRYADYAAVVLLAAILATVLVRARRAVAR